MRKSLLLALILLTTGTASAQHFSIDDNFYDSLDVNSYNLHFQGRALFNDSMTVYYSVKTNDSIPQLLFIDSVDFTTDTISYPAGFTYNATDSTIQIAFGNYGTPNMILELYSLVQGVTREHIYVNVYNYATLPEDEE